MLVTISCSCSAPNRPADVRLFVTCGLLSGQCLGSWCRWSLQAHRLHLPAHHVTTWQRMSRESCRLRSPSCLHQQAPQAPSSKLGSCLSSASSKALWAPIVGTRGASGPYCRGLKTGSAKGFGKELFTVASYWPRSRKLCSVRRGHCGRMQTWP